jgi:hypothetical protein
MPSLARITRIVAFLRSEIPAEDISANPVVKHPHNTSRSIPERLPPVRIKELSTLDAARAIAATAEEWASIAAAVALCWYFWHPVLYLIVAVFIGARQHALIIMGHDASHYRYLPTRWQNELRQPVLDVAGVRDGRGLPEVSRHASPIHQPAGRRKSSHLAHPRRRGGAGTRLEVSQDKTWSGVRVIAPRAVSDRHVVDRPWSGGAHLLFRHRIG